MPHSAPHELSTPVLIVGAGAGGVASALSCAESGVACVVTEPTDWIGGQFTAQAVPPDENQWIESFGGTRRYQFFRERCRAWYRANRPLRPEHRDNPLLNPGQGWVSRLCVEPRVAHAVLVEMLAPHVASGLVRVVLNAEPTSVDASGDSVRAVGFDTPGGPLTIRADYVLDATELGDLYPMASVEHAIGAESVREYGEMHARLDAADPMDQQAFSWCFAVEHRPGEDHTIPRPRNYEFWRSFVPTMAPGEQPWSGPLFSWTVPSHNTEGKRTFPFIPWPEACPESEWDMWRYRRIADASLCVPTPAFSPVDVCLVNWVQMDYWLKPLLGVSVEAQREAYAGAREQSLCLLYWMQTEAPHHRGVGRGSGIGFPGLKLRGEELGTSDGFAKAAYIREPRRLLARGIVAEGHIGTEQRRSENRPNMDETPMGSCEPFADSVGIGHYTLDLHPSTAGRNSIYVPAAPFRIPLGALIPRRVRNLIAAGKGIGVTHITNGCYRMHHTEWNIGEVAGTLAAHCVKQRCEPHEVHESLPKTREFQRVIREQGVPLSWPWEQGRGL